MPTTIGRRRRNRVLLPQNRGLSAIAQRKLEQVVGQANRAGQEAINTDGYPVRIWKRQSGSIRCTCNQNYALGDDTSNDALADDPQWDGDTNEKTFERSDSLPPLNFGPLGSIVLRDSDRPYDSGIIPNHPRPKPSLDDIDREFTGEEYEFDDEFEQDPNDLQRRHLGNLQRHILGTQKFRCPICFGTSYTDTYIFGAGHRYIFDASGQIPFKLVGGSIDPKGVPHRFELSGPNDAIIWRVTFPPYYVKVASVRIFDGFDRALGVHAEWRTADTVDEWVELTPITLEALRNNSQEIEIRVTPLEAQLDDTLGFTHLEVNYEVVELPRAQIPQLNRANTLFSPEDILSIEAEIDPIVGWLRKESILEVASHGTIWKIGNITNRQTAGKQLFGYQLEMTLMHASEQSSILRISNSSAAATHAPFAGLEQVQGEGTL